MALSFNNAKNKVSEINTFGQEVSEGIDDSEAKTIRAGRQYDKAAKHALSNKSILANIMKSVIDEYKDMSIPEIINCIAGGISVQSTPIDPGKSNIAYNHNDGSRVVGRTAEDSVENEGFITFDIVFDAVVGGKLSSMIINVESQKSVNLPYDLSKRAVYYVSRLISSQKAKDFVKSEYDKIKPVYNIWVCMNMPEVGITKVHLQEDRILGNIGWTGGLGLLNIVFIGVVNDINKVQKGNITECLSILFSNMIEDKERERRLIEEYSIDFDKDLREDVDSMSETAEIWLEELRQKEAKSKAIGKAELIKDMLNKGLTLEQISELIGYSVDELKNILTLVDTQ